MDNNIGKNYAIRWLNTYKPFQLTIETLQGIIEQQNYRVIWTNKIENHEAVEALLQEIECEKYANGCKAFTYKDGSNKIVFIDDNLSDSDKIQLLIHEEGHIFCGHMDHSEVSISSVSDEWEANEFTHYVLNPPLPLRFKQIVVNNKKSFIICLACLIIGTILAFSVWKYNKSKNDEYVRKMDYYITETGTKYHSEGCKYLVNKENIRKITEEEYSSGVYQPCKECVSND